MAGWLGGWEEFEIRLSSGKRKLELGLGLSLAKEGATFQRWGKIRGPVNLINPYFHGLDIL